MKTARPGVDFTVYIKRARVLYLVSATDHSKPTLASPGTGTQQTTYNTERAYLATSGTDSC